MRLRFPVLAAACALGLGLGSEADAAAPAAQGAVVVAVGEDVGDATASLARSLYRDQALRPSLDEARARVLAGAPAPEGASPALRDLAELRASIARAGSDVAERRLLAAIGAEVHAAVVVPVVRREGAVHARALRVEGASFVGPELTAELSTDATGRETARWSPSAAATVRTATGASAPRPIQAPARPAADEHASKSTFSSPWLWAGVSAAVIAGVTAFVLSQTTSSDPSTVRVGGTVPR
jgi:hypothetical protein